MTPKPPGRQRWGPNPRAKSAGPATAVTASILAEGVDRHRRGLLDEAAALYRRVLEASPEQADALHLLGRIAEAGRPAEALALIDRAIAANGRVSATTPVAARCCCRSAGLRTPRDRCARRFRSSRTTPRRPMFSATRCLLSAIRPRRSSAIGGPSAPPGVSEAHNNLGSALRAGTPRGG